jgi:hypothetical protein
MQKIFKPTIAAILSTIVALLMGFTPKINSSIKTTHTIIEKPKIQVAILLDVSNSMDGLIEQTKAQLWNMVNLLGRAGCEGVAPDVEIALYEYGRTNNDAKAGYVKQINGFITNLDSLSENLFNLKTSGGDEYCGHAIYTSVKELQWDAKKENYKVIFIAGNEDFLQGKIQFTEACGLAKEKGIIINTIYCGDKMQGISEHWNLNNKCNGGSYTNINADATMEDIATPYDSILYVLNSRLNNTYLSYGARGKGFYDKQAKMDQANAKMSNEVAMKRIAVKGKKNVYKNTDWDLVDGLEQDATLISKIDKSTLPDTLKNKTKEEIVKIVTEKSKERTAVQSEIETTNAKRELYLIEERKKRAANKNEPTLETEMEKTLRSQSKNYNIIIQ